MEGIMEEISSWFKVVTVDHSPSSIAEVKKA
jgi:hypothetical protein